MIGDNLIITPIHQEKAAETFGAFNPVSHSVIAIGGESGTGKSEVAHLLRKFLYESYDMSSVILSLDDYYKTHPLEREALRKEKGIESVGINEIDWKEVDYVIEDFEQRGHVFFKEYDKFVEGYRHILIEEIPDVLIIEGLYALCCYCNFGVYLQGNYKETKAFRLERGKEDSTYFRQKVLEKEHRDVSSTRIFADLII